MPEAVIAAHDDSTPLAAVAAVESRGLAYGGQGLLGGWGRVESGTGLVPLYVHLMLGGATSEPEFRSELARTWAGSLLAPAPGVVRHDGPVLAALHPNWGYGHFLVEVLPRLLLLDRAAPPDWPLALPAPAPGWIEAMVALAAPGRPVLRHDPAREVIVAPALVGCADPAPQARLRPALVALLDAFKARALAAASRGDGPGPRRLWVSRAGIGGATHRLRREEAVERVAEARGLTVVRPETLSLAEQVRLFDGAAMVAGLYGSGMHNTLFSRPGTVVVALNWINAYESNIASSLRQTVGYVLPDDGRFRDASAVLVAARLRIPFSPDRVGRRLDAALAEVERRGGS